MNAPIDDLLYGGDDSGDEDMNVNGALMPMNNFKTPMVPGGTMPLVNSAGAIGATGMFNGGAIGMGMVTGGIPAQQLKPPGAISMTVPTSVASAPAPTPAAAAKPAPAKQPGTGQQMFQQMFALLKQMLPPEQYATLHSEMRKGNGNDIKSIVDIIKRIAGDAIFANVIQKMDLTRSFPSNVNQVKAEPSITPQVIAAQVPLAPPATLIGTSAAAVQRPSVPVLPTGIRTVKSEPTPAATIATSSVSTTRNEALDKIEFAKKLLFHASACLLPAGQCKVKKCDDVRRVFKHSTSCGGARGCNHCEQLKGLVKYHAKDCKASITDHCKIPFCDGLRRAYANVAAALAAKANAAATPAPALSTTASAAAVPGTSSIPAKANVRSANSSSEDDNAPLASSLTKKGNTKKSPKASSPNTSATASSLSTSMIGTTTSSTPTSSVAAMKSKAVPANPTQEYGRLLQLILHVQKCTTALCPIGEECVESKTLLRQINAPNAPKRAQTYKQVYSHYKQCLSKNNTQNCPVCKIGLRPITPGTLTSPSPSSALAPIPAAITSSMAASSTNSSVTKRPTSSPASSNSPPKKQQKSPSSLSKKNSNNAISSAASEQANLASLELAQSNVGDLRKEADVLTHTGIELSSEKRTMMDGVRRQAIPLPAEQLACKKEEWEATDLFNNQALKSQMEIIGKKIGVQMGKQTTEVMSYALQEYLKQVMEEMVEISKQRCDSFNQALEKLQKRRPSTPSSTSAASAVELTATDILRVSCENSFAQVRIDDLMLRAQLLEDANREEQLEKERAKKRKKVDRLKLTTAQEREKEEKDMDIVELATKDLKQKLFKEDKEGVVRVEGRVNESIHTKYQRRLDVQVTMEDAAFWLQSQKPYINPKLFVRAEAARIVTNSLN